MYNITDTYLKELFPQEKTNDFFEALFGGAEEGAYDIHLALVSEAKDKIHLNFELHGRKDKCLACNLTSGLPHVFSRHPIIGSAKIASALAEKAGWQHYDFAVETTEQISKDLHVIPLIIKKK